MTDRWMEEAERLRELVEPLLDAFYAQGKEGRNHDDEAGSAQTADDALMAGIRAALSAAHEAGRLEALALPLQPDEIAAAWDTWKSRHGGELGPGPAFVEAIEAAIRSRKGK